MFVPPLLPCLFLLVPLFSTLYGPCVCETTTPRPWQLAYEAQNLDTNWLAELSIADVAALEQPDFLTTLKAHRNSALRQRPSDKQSILQAFAVLSSTRLRNEFLRLKRIKDDSGSVQPVFSNLLLGDDISGRNATFHWDEGITHILSVVDYDPADAPSIVRAEREHELKVVGGGWTSLPSAADNHLLESGKPVVESCLDHSNVGSWRQLAFHTASGMRASTQENHVLHSISHRWLFLRDGTRADLLSVLPAALGFMHGAGLLPPFDGCFHPAPSKQGSLPCQWLREEVRGVPNLLGHSWSPYQYWLKLNGLHECAEGGPCLDTASHAFLEWNWLQQQLEKATQYFLDGVTKPVAWSTLGEEPPAPVATHMLCPPEEEVLEFSDSPSNELPLASNLLVHCQKGSSRSVSVVVAYLMSLRIPLPHALALVRGARPIAAPHPALLRELAFFELCGADVSHKVFRLPPKQRKWVSTAPFMVNSVCCGVTAHSSLQVKNWLLEAGGFHVAALQAAVDEISVPPILAEPRP